MCQKRGLRANPSAPNLWDHENNAWLLHPSGAPAVMCMDGSVTPFTKLLVSSVPGEHVCATGPVLVRTFLKGVCPSVHTCVYGCMWVCEISTHPCPHSSPGEERVLLPRSALCTSPCDGYSNLLTSCFPHTPLQEHFSHWCFPLPSRSVTFLW